jgi:hypothetical protein
MLGSLAVRAGPGEVLEVGGARLRTLLIMLARSWVHPGRWSGQAMREPEIVADQRARSGLPAGYIWLEDQRAQPFGRGVDHGRQPGRPGADDRHVTRAQVRGRPKAQLDHQVLVRGVDQH